MAHKKILYIVGGLYYPNGMAQILSQKINYLAEKTDYDLYMVLTEREDLPWYYDMPDKVKWVNFDLNFDDLDEMPAIQRLMVYHKKNAEYKDLLEKYILELKPDITISICRRELNFLNTIPDGSKKIGEFHFDRKSYRQFYKSFLPSFVNHAITDFWMDKMIREVRKLDAFVVLTSYDKKSWPEIDNVRVIPNAIRTVSDTKSSLKEKNVIAVGSYNHVKGYDMLFEAWKIVEQKYPDWHLNIYGNGKNDLFQQMAQSGGLKNVSCNSAVRDIYNKYRESSIFVMSSRHEGFGLAIAEAQSCGLPVVSFDCPYGPREIINDGKDGFLIEERNVELMAEEIIYLIEHEEVRHEMGEAAILNSKRFDEDTVMKMWMDLFDSVLY